MGVAKQMIEPTPTPASTRRGSMPSETAIEAAIGPNTAYTARLLMNCVTTIEMTANAVASTTGLVIEGNAA